MDLEGVTNGSLGGRKICGSCFSIDGGAGILLIGEYPEFPVELSRVLE